MSSLKRASVFLILIGAAVSSLPAQETPPTPPPAPAPAAGGIAVLETKPSLSEDEKTQLKAWIVERVDKIVNQSRDDHASTAAAATAAADLRKERPSATPGFREAYVSLCVEVMSPVYKGAKMVASAQLVTILAGLREMATSKVLLEALGHEQPAVRAAAASGLRGLRAKLAAAGAPVLNEALAALREAGRRESSQVALKAIYGAMNVREVVQSHPDPKRNATDLLDLLEARSEQYTSKKVKGEGAEVLGLAVMNGYVSNLGDAEKDRLVIAAARMMLHAVQRYVDELSDVHDKTSAPLLVEARNNAELLIEGCEKLLKELIKPAAPAPDLTKELRASEKDEGEKRTKLRQEMAKWSQILSAKTNQKFELDEDGE